MAYTLLDYVQMIASSMESDEVNSIGDTTESTQIAYVVRSVWDDVVARLDLPEHYTMFPLDGSVAGKPTLMYRPSTADSIISLRYDCKTLSGTSVDFRELVFLDMDTFLERMYALNDDNTNVLSFTHTINGNAIPFLVENDHAPQYYTTPDDTTILFDAYDATLDTAGLVSSKSVAYGRIHKTFTLSDSFIPVIDPDFQVLLLNEAKSLAFAELKGIEHSKAEKISRKEWVHAQHGKRGVNQNRDELSRAPNYGRPGSMSRTTTFTNSQRNGS